MSYINRLFAIALLSFSLTAGLEAKHEIPGFDETEWEVELIKDAFKATFHATIALAKVPGYSIALTAKLARSANETMHGLVKYLQKPYHDDCGDEQDGQ